MRKTTHNRPPTPSMKAAISTPNRPANLSPTNPKSQTHPPVPPSPPRILRTRVANQKMAVGLSHHRGSQSLPKRRPLSHAIRGFDNNLRRALLHRQDRRIRLSQRHLYSRRECQQVHQAQNLRHSSRPSLRPLGSSSRFQNNNFRRKGSQGQDLP